MWPTFICYLVQGKCTLQFADFWQLDIISYGDVRIPSCQTELFSCRMLIQTFPALLWL